MLLYLLEVEGLMLGAIAGDIIGSVYERNNIQTKDFPLFTNNCRFSDDTVLTVAIAEQALTCLDEPLRIVTQDFISQFISPIPQ